MFASTTKTTAFYAIAGVVAVGALVSVGRSMLVPSGAKACGDRYANSTLFRLDSDAGLLTVQDVRSRVGEHRTVGLSENAEIMKPRDPRIPAALQVTLRNSAGAQGRTLQTAGGVSFPWQPRSVQSETATCLSYEVFFYADLEFNDGGTLPGIQGADHSHATLDGFAAQLAWYEDGHPGVRLYLANEGETGIMNLDARGFTFPRGQWVRIDQEVILNAPGESNGVLRLWIDRELALERTDIAYRGHPEIGVAGVAAKVFYGAPDAMAWAPSETTVWISPLELSWQ